MLILWLEQRLAKHIELYQQPYKSTAPAQKKKKATKNRTTENNEKKICSKADFFL
jgi:hypothetical protein